MAPADGTAIASLSAVWHTVRCQTAQEGTGAPIGFEADREGTAGTHGVPAAFWLTFASVTTDTTPSTADTPRFQDPLCFVSPPQREALMPESDRAPRNRAERRAAASRERRRERGRDRC